MNSDLIQIKNSKIIYRLRVGAVINEGAVELYENQYVKISELEKLLRPRFERAYRYSKFTEYLKDEKISRYIYFWDNIKTVDSSVEYGKITCEINGSKFFPIKFLNIFLTHHMGSMRPKNLWEKPYYIKNKERLIEEIEKTVKCKLPSANNSVSDSIRITAELYFGGPIIQLLENLGIVYKQSNYYYTNGKRNTQVDIDCERFRIEIDEYHHRRENKIIKKDIKTRNVDTRVETLSINPNDFNNDQFKIVLAVIKWLKEKKYILVSF